MISDFERRLADVLGERLPAPFHGRVGVAPTAVAGTGPQVLVAVRAVEALDPEFDGHRPRVAPGAAEPRRLVRARCTVDVEVRPASGEGRDQQMGGVDAVLFELDGADVRDGSALAPGNGADPGFLIERMRVLVAMVPRDPAAADAGSVAVTALAEGWFWPVGSVGAAGPEMRIRLRQGLLPVQVAPSRPRIAAGGPSVDLVVQVEAAGTLGLEEPGEPASPLPFGSLAVTLTGRGGRPGAGSLSGGAEGAPGVRIVPLVEGELTVTYDPPAAAATDELVVGFDDGEGGLGPVLGRVALTVREA